MGASFMLVPFSVLKDMPYTLISAVNRVLLNCGERPLISSNSTIGQLVVSALTTALVDCASLSDWPWLKTKVLADSWVADVATLPSYTQRIRFVNWDTGAGYKNVDYAPESEYVKWLPSYGFDGTLVEGEPLIYSITGVNECRVLPYPTSTTEKAKVWFHIVRWLTMPTTDTSSFTVIPDQFMELVFSRASYLFGVARHGDPEKFSQQQQQYEVLAQQLRTRFMGGPTHGHSMYKDGRL